jgi:hypothetical protein
MMSKTKHIAKVPKRKPLDGDHRAVLRRASYQVMVEPLRLRAMSCVGPSMPRSPQACAQTWSPVCAWRHAKLGLPLWAVLVSLLAQLVSVLPPVIELFVAILVSHLHLC